MHPVASDHANKKFKEQLALVGLKWRQDAGIGSEIFGNQTLAQLLCAWREMQFARAAIRTIGAPVYETHRLQLIDDLAGIDRNDPDRFRQSALIDPGYSIDASERRPLERRQVFAHEGFGHHNGANLLKVP